MELLIIKNKQDYIRVRADRCEIVGLDKASVFPMDQLDRVKETAARLKQEGYDRICLKKLVLTEKDL